MNPKALYNLTYGVYLLTAKEDGSLLKKRA